MVGSVLSVLPGRLEALGIWIAGLSPVTLPLYGAASLLSISDLPKGTRARQCRGPSTFG
jgi:hypothetical protein